MPYFKLSLNPGTRALEKKIVRNVEELLFDIFRRISLRHKDFFSDYVSELEHLVSLSLCEV